MGTWTVLPKGPVVWWYGKYTHKPLMNLIGELRKEEVSCYACDAAVPVLRDILTKGAYEDVVERGNLVIEARLVRDGDIKYALQGTAVYQREDMESCSAMSVSCLWGEILAVVTEVRINSERIAAARRQALRRVGR